MTPKASRKKVSTAQASGPHRGWISITNADDIEQLAASRRAFDGEPTTTTRTRNGGVRKRVVFDDYEHAQEEPRKRAKTVTRMSRLRGQEQVASISAVREVSDQNENKIVKPESSPAHDRHNHAADDGLPWYDEIEVEQPHKTTQIFQPPKTKGSSIFAMYFKNNDGEPYSSTNTPPVERLRDMMSAMVPTALATALARNDDQGFLAFAPHSKSAESDGEYTMWCLLAPYELLLQYRMKLWRSATQQVHTLKATFDESYIQGQKVEIKCTVSKGVDVRSEYGDFAQFDTTSLCMVKGILCHEEYMMWGLLVKNDEVDALRKSMEPRQTLVIEANFGHGIGVSPSVRYERPTSQ